MIILENTDDRVFEHIVAEDSQDLIALDGDILPSNKRLVHEDFLDIIIDESGVALEENFQFMMEDYTPSVALNSLVAESGDNLQLEHVNNLYFSDEGEIKAIEHLSYDLKISDFTPSLGHASADGAPSGDIIPCLSPEL